MRYVVIPLLIILYSWWTYNAFRYKFKWSYHYKYEDAWFSWKFTNLFVGGLIFGYLCVTYW